MQTIDEGLHRGSSHDHEPSLHHVLYEHGTLLPDQGVRDPRGRQNSPRNGDRKPLQLQTGEKVTAAIPMREIDDDKVPLHGHKERYGKEDPDARVQQHEKTGLQAILLREGDELIEVKVTEIIPRISSSLQNSVCPSASRKRMRELPAVFPMA